MTFLEGAWKSVTNYQSSPDRSQEIEGQVNPNKLLDADNTKIIKAMIKNDLLEIPFNYRNFLADFNNFVIELRKTYETNGLDDSFLSVFLTDADNYTGSVINQYQSSGGEENIINQNQEREGFHNKLPTAIINYANLINQGFDIKPLLDLLKECGLNKKVDDYNRLFACYNLLNNSDNSQLDVINKKGSPAVIDKNDACSYNQAVGNLAIRLSALMKWQKFNNIHKEIAEHEIGVDLLNLEAIK